MGRGCGPPRWIMTAGLNLLMGMMGRAAQQAAEIQHVARLVADGRDDSTAVVLLFTIPMAASSAIRAADDLGGGVAGDDHHVDAHGATVAVMASSFSSVRLPQLAALIMPSSSDTGMNAPDRPPTWLLAITPPF